MYLKRYCGEKLSIDLNLGGTFCMCCFSCVAISREFGLLMRVHGTNEESRAPGKFRYADRSKETRTEKLESRFIMERQAVFPYEKA